MSDGKDYVSTDADKGSVNISEDVVASIAALAVSEVEGVGGLASSSGIDISGLIGKKNLAKGIKILLSGEVVSIDAFVIVKYDFRIPEVGRALQDAVTAAVESTTGLKVSEVNVHVTGIVQEKKPPQPDRPHASGEGRQ